MIYLVNHENRACFTSYIDEMHRHRKAVFVDALGWQVPVRAGREIDAYDTGATHYLMALDEPHGTLRASARLMPTNAAHLMGDHFAHLCSSGAPHGATVWEASRFCPAPHVARRTRIALLGEIFSAVMETSLLFGIEHIIFTANAALLPLALRCGWHARPLGPTVADGHDAVTAVGVDINLIGLRTLRRRFGLTGPVIRFLEPARSLAA